MDSGKHFSIKWCKLELGSVCTKFIEPNHSVELIKCQRYFLLGYCGDEVMTADNNQISCTFRTPSIDCDPSPEYHMHEFGVIQSYSASFNGEMGDTSKVTMMVVDDLLNPYHLLTNRIIDMDFPPLVREELEDSKDKNISVKKKISRNEKCPCGSGLKYKFCCGKNK